MLTQNEALNELQERAETRKLYIEYGDVFDISRPPSLENRGVYPWQQQFHNAGADHAERLLIAANRVGKTQSAAAETAMHATGIYPAWFRGRRFTAPTMGWTGAESNELSRDVVQLALLGVEGKHGTGWIPKERIIAVKRRQSGIGGVVDHIQVRHKTGGMSTIILKTYEQGPEKWVGAKLDFVWLDEEAPMNIYTEALTRTLDRRGIVYTTFTPLNGQTELVLHFSRGGDGIYMQNVTWDEAYHLDEDAKKRLRDSYPEHVRDARTKGIPMLGSGAVFPIPNRTGPTPQPWRRRHLRLRS